MLFRSMLKVCMPIFGLEFLSMVFLFVGGGVKSCMHDIFISASKYLIWGGGACGCYSILNIPVLMFDMSR